MESSYNTAKQSPESSISCKNLHTKSFLALSHMDNISDLIDLSASAGPRSYLARMKATDNTLSETQGPLVSEPAFEPWDFFGDDGQDYHYEPIAALSDVYDTEIDNVSDLDPNDPLALREFQARIGSSQFASHESFPPQMSARLPHLETKGKAKAAYKALPERTARSEGGYEAGDEWDEHSSELDSFEPTIVDQTPRFASSYISLLESENPGTAGLPAHDAISDHHAGQPVLARRFDLPIQNFSPPYDSDTSSSFRWTRMDSSTDCRTHNKKTPSTTRERSPLREFLEQSSRGTVVNFERYAGPKYYPKAAKLFAVDAGTGQFRNPFMNPPSMVGGTGDRTADQVSPLEQPICSNRIDDWHLGAKGEHRVSPTSLLSDFGQFEGDVRIPTPSNHCPVHARRSSGVFGVGIGAVPLITNPGSYPFLSPSPSSTSFSFGEGLYPSQELDRQLGELQFDNAAL